MTSQHSDTPYHGVARTHQPSKDAQTEHQQQSLKRKQSCSAKPASLLPLQYSPSRQPCRKKNNSVAGPHQQQNHQSNHALSPVQIPWCRWNTLQLHSSSRLRDPRHFYNFYRPPISAGLPPQIWREATLASIRTPNKSDYTIHKAYRPISLPTCLGKVWEKIIASRLGYFPEIYHLLNKWQIGSRLKRSAVKGSFLIAITGDIAKHKGITIPSLCMDVTGAFDDVPHGRLLNTLKKRDSPPQLRRLVESFLSNRTTCLTFDGQIDVMSPLRTGNPT